MWDPENPMQIHKVLLHGVQAGVQKRTTITGLSHSCNHEITICYILTPCCDHLSDYRTAFFVARHCDTHIANNSMHCSEGVFGDSIRESLPTYSYLNLCYLHLCSMLKDKMYSNNSCTKDITKQDRQCRYNVTLRCVHATLVAV